MKAQVNKVLLFVFVLLWNGLNLLAQDGNLLYPLISKGRLPNDFVTRSSEKYEADKANLSKNEKDKKVKQSALLASNFEIDDMLLSGYVLFNDTLGEYVNRVADKLLEKDVTGLRRKLRFYIFKSTSVNAFATQQGMIFINVGLLAHVNNESELAMVLSHEIQHYLLQHTITAAVEEHKIKKGKGAYKRLEGKRAQMLARCLFSKEQETEADAKGFELFKKSDYLPDSVCILFDMLKYSYLPFRDDFFAKSFFETPYYKLPDRFLLVQPNPIDTTDDNDDKKSTHPSIPKRRKAILEAVAKIGDKKGKRVYLVGKKEFEICQRIARYEETALYMLDHDYERCIYNAYLLLKDDPNNIELRKMVLHSLTALGVYSAKNFFYTIHEDAEEKEGQSQALFNLFEKMDSASHFEIPVLALAYGAKLVKEYPKDKEIQADMRAIGSVLKLYGIDESYFNNETSTSKKTSSFSASTKSSEDKKDVVVKSKKEKKQKKEEDDEAGDDEDGGLFASASKKRDESGSRPADDYTHAALAEYKNERWIPLVFKAKKEDESTALEDDEFEGKKGRKRANNQTSALGLTKVLVVNPDFTRINEEMEEPIRYLRGERGRVDFSERIKDNARVAKLDVELLDSHNLQAGDVAELNDIALLQDYLRDQNMHGGVGVPFPYRTQLNRLIKKYGCSHVLWTGVISHQEKYKKRTGLAIGSAIFPPMLPFTLSRLVNRGFWTYYFNLMFDLKKDKPAFANFRMINNRTEPYILNSHIYDTFYQLKHK